MDIATRNRLLEYLPDESIYRIAGVTPPFDKVNENPARGPVALKFMIAQQKPDFGMAYCTEMVRMDIRKFPSWLKSSDRPLFQVYLFQCNSKYATEEILEALTINTQPSLRDVLEAFLLCGDFKDEDTAREMNLSVKTVTVYRLMYFDVADLSNSVRASIAFPSGRLPELLEGHVERLSLRQLLLRAAFVHGADHVRYFAGHTADIPGGSSPDESAKRLEAMTLKNAELLGKNGFLNQKEMPGVVRGQQAATRRGKTNEQSGGNGSNPLSQFGEIIRKDINRFGSDAYKKAEMARVRQQYGKENQG